jgi:hypothetical protein
MQSPSRALAIGAVAIAAAVALFLVLQDGDDDTEPATTSPATTVTTDAEPDQGANGEEGSEQPAPEVATIVVRNGQPVGGVQELEFAKGERIRFVVESDVDEEVHLHGYDVAKDVKAGGQVSFDVAATLEGVFEVELEHSVVPLAEITVTPG